MRTSIASIGTRCRRPRQRVIAAALSFTANAGTARSQGIEVDAQARFLDAFTANLSFQYDDAKYTADAIAAHGLNGHPDLISAYKGQKFAIPPWSIAAGLRYDLVFGDYNPYFRVDYRVQAGYDKSQYGLGDYAPDTNHVSTENLVNVRAGVDYGNYDINVYATNVLDNHKYGMSGGRESCTDPTCTSFSQYGVPFGIIAPFPRTVGLQLIYRQ